MNWRKFLFWKREPEPIIKLLPHTKFRFVQVERVGKDTYWVTEEYGPCGWICIPESATPYESRAKKNYNQIVQNGGAGKRTVIQETE